MGAVNSTIQSLREQLRTRPTLDQAVQSGDLETVRERLACGDNSNEANEQGVTALMFAISGAHEHPHILRELLGAEGVNINAADALGCTALMRAAAYGNSELIKLLCRGPYDRISMELFWTFLTGTRNASSAVQVLRGQVE